LWATGFALRPLGFCPTDDESKEHGQERIAADENGFGERRRHFSAYWHNSVTGRDRRLPAALIRVHPLLSVSVRVLQKPSVIPKPAPNAQCDTAFQSHCGIGKF
jgi:hypothetical protein